MATIKISELRPTGYDLFQDAETFLNELTTKEMNFVVGGVEPLLVVADGNQVQAVTVYTQGKPYAATVRVKTVAETSY